MGIRRMAEQDKQITVIGEYAPSEDRMVRALLIALDFTPEEIDLFFREPEALQDHTDRRAA